MIFYENELTLSKIEEVSQSLTPGENKEMWEKINGVMGLQYYGNALNFALAKESMRLGYLLAHLKQNKKDITAQEAIKKYGDIF